MSDITSICRTAWQQVKREDQPDYDDLVESYRTMLTARAEGVIATGAISEDAPFHPFENAVLSQGVSSKSETAVTEIDDIVPLKIDESEYQPTPDLPHEIDNSIKTAGINSVGVVEPPTETLEEAEAARLDRAKRRDEATKGMFASKKKAAPKKKPSPKTAVKKPAKKKVALKK